MAPTSDRIVIGVDFGTTFSGVAEAYSGTAIAADEINVIKDWPGSKRGTSDKVPSEITYTSDTKEKKKAGGIPNSADAFGTAELQTALKDIISDSGDSTTVRWGFQIKPDEQRLRCVKLFLDPGQALPSFVSSSEIQQLLADCGKDAVSVVADYLTQIHRHTKEMLNTRYGDYFVETTAIQWVLTVPAIWSDAAKNATLTAAKRSGMGPELSLISEPEAAAVYTLQAIQPNHLRIGDNFVVCDAGGGTVDLISYEIRQTSPLRIEESAKGSGACCGGAMLNLKFEELIEEKMGLLAFAKLRREKPRAWVMALGFFEDYVKRNFDPTDPTDFNIPLPGVPDNEDAGIEQGFLTLFDADLSKMFLDIIDDIMYLIDGQIQELQKKNKNVAGIVLVGGFGQSSCLYKSLKRTYTGRLKGRKADACFEVLQPSNAWTAVVRGAVLRGVEGVEMVLSRKSRRHYGVSCTMTFNPLIHPKNIKEWCPREGEWKANDQMKWCIEKGQTVSSTEPMIFDFYRKFPPGASKTVVEELIVCDRDKAPTHFKRSDGFPSKVLCSMVINLNKVPAHLFETHTAVDETSYERLDYQLGMQIESGGLKFDLKVNDVSYGNVVAAFDGE